MCIQHYKSIRKHSCFKDIKKEREEAAKERLKLIKQINAQRANSKSPDKEAANSEEPQQNETAVEAVSAPPAEIQQGSEASRILQARYLITEEETIGPTGWAS
jgi:hypothetical protein